MGMHNQFQVFKPGEQPPFISKILKGIIDIRLWVIARFRTLLAMDQPFLALNIIKIRAMPGKSPAIK
jgi:hypothetical protein